MGHIIEYGLLGVGVVALFVWPLWSIHDAIKSCLSELQSINEELRQTRSEADHHWRER